MAYLLPVVVAEDIRVEAEDRDLLRTMLELEKYGEENKEELCSTLVTFLGNNFFVQVSVFNPDVKEKTVLPEEFKNRFRNGVPNYLENFSIKRIGCKRKK